MDVTLKDIPDGITEQQVKEWVSVLIERFHTTKIQKIPELVAAQEIAKASVDSFRTANELTAKYEVVPK